MRSAIVILSSVLALVAATLCAAPQPARGGPAAKSTFLVLYRPGPHWAPGKPIREQPPKEHGKYLLELYRRGAMKFAGPFDDDTGGAVVLEAADAAEARSLVDGDPAVKAGIFAVEMHPWALVPWDSFLKKK